MPKTTEAIKVYCPVCLKLGRKKWIDTVSPEAKGILYPYCKCHGNVRVDLDKLDGEKIYIRVPECH